MQECNPFSYTADSQHWVLPNNQKEMSNNWLICLRSKTGIGILHSHQSNHDKSWNEAPAADYTSCTSEAENMSHLLSTTPSIYLMQ